MSDCKDITFILPREFVVPSVYFSKDSLVVATLLQLGAISYDIVSNEGEAHMNAETTERLRQTASKEFLKKESEYSSKIQGYEQIVESLKSRLGLVEQERQEVEKRVREDERRNREELMTEKNLRIQRLEKQVQDQIVSIEQSCRESNRGLLDGFQSFKEQIIRSTTGSSNKGKMGETAFSDLLRRAFGSVGNNEEFHTEDVGKEGHQGDIHMSWLGHKLLWEVKNYTRNIDQKEVNKFLNDMELNADFSLGVMISLHTGIAGHTKAGGIDIEELRDGRICVYITHFSRSDDTLLTLQSLRPFLEAFLKRRGLAGVSEDTAARLKLDRFEQQRTILLKLVNRHKESMNKFRTTVMNAKKKQEQIWTDITIESRQMDHDVKLIVETLLDVEAVEDSVDEIEIPVYLFRHTDWTSYNEKEQKFIRDTLNGFECGEDFMSPTKAVKEVYKKLGYSEDSLNSFRSAVFSESAWEKGKKDVKGLRIR